MCARKESSAELVGVRGNVAVVTAAGENPNPNVKVVVVKEGDNNDTVTNKRG